jgi:hypothetical protein
VGTVTMTRGRTDGSIVENSVANVYFENPHPPGSVGTCDDPPVGCDVFFGSGTLTYTRVVPRAGPGTCGSHATGSGLINLVMLTIFTDEDPPSYVGGGLDTVNGTVTSDCGGSDPLTDYGFVWWETPGDVYSPDAPRFQLKQDGLLIEDTWTQEAGDWYYIYDWRLEPAE